MMYFWLLVAILFIERFFELYVSNRNGKTLAALGAKEYGSSHFKYIVLLHIIWGVSGIWEVWVRGYELSQYWPLWLSLLIMAEILRYWSIICLGHCWSVRIMVISGALKVKKGPYRILRHPIYIALLIDMFSASMLYKAWITAVIVTILNLIVIGLLRIPTENRALEQMY